MDDSNENRDDGRQALVDRLRAVLSKWETLPADRATRFNGLLEDIGALLVTEPATSAGRVRTEAPPVPTEALVRRVWVVHTVYLDGDSYAAFEFKGVYESKYAARLAAETLRRSDGSPVQKIQHGTEDDVRSDDIHGVPEVLITETELRTDPSDGDGWILTQLRAVSAKWDNQLSIIDNRDAGENLRVAFGLLADIRQLIEGVSRPAPDRAPPEPPAPITDQAAPEFSQVGAIPLLNHFTVVTPERWDQICCDRFVFGYVVAEAFAKCAPLRVTFDGFIFEREQLTATDLQRLGERLDDFAAHAFHLRAAMAQLGGLFRDSPQDLRRGCF